MRTKRAEGNTQEAPSDLAIPSQLRQRPRASRENPATWLPPFTKALTLWPADKRLRTRLPLGASGASLSSSRITPDLNETRLHFVTPRLNILNRPHGTSQPRTSEYYGIGNPEANSLVWYQLAIVIGGKGAPCYHRPTSSDRRERQGDHGIYGSSGSKSEDPHGDLGPADGGLLPGICPGQRGDCTGALRVRVSALPPAEFQGLPSP